MPVDLTIKGLQEAQARNLRDIAALEPGGAVEAAVQWGIAEAHRYAVSITHVDTGSWRASHRLTITDRGLTGIMDINPSARNPRSRAKPEEYAAVWEARGGEMAVYARTVGERGAYLIEEMGRIIGGAWE